MVLIKRKRLRERVVILIVLGNNKFVRQQTSVVVALAWGVAGLNLSTWVIPSFLKISI